MAVLEKRLSKSVVDSLEPVLPLEDSSGTHVVEEQLIRGGLSLRVVAQEGQPFPLEGDPALRALARQHLPTKKLGAGKDISEGRIAAGANDPEPPCAVEPETGSAKMWDRLACECVKPRSERSRQVGTARDLLDAELVGLPDGRQFLGKVTFWRDPPRDLIESLSVIVVDFNPVGPRFAYRKSIRPGCVGQIETASAGRIELLQSTEDERIRCSSKDPP